MSIARKLTVVGTFSLLILTSLGLAPAAYASPADATNCDDIRIICIDIQGQGSHVDVAAARTNSYAGFHGTLHVYDDYRYINNYSSPANWGVRYNNTAFKVRVNNNFPIFDRICAEGKNDRGDLIGRACYTVHL